MTQDRETESAVLLSRNRPSRRTVAVLASIALGVSGALVATPAMAANHCTSGRVCLWDYSDYSVLLISRAGGSSTITNLPLVYADKTAAAGNDSNYAAGLWGEPNGTSNCWTVSAKSSRSFGVLDRDRVESWRTQGGC